VPGSCEHSNEPLSSVSDGEFLDLLTYSLTHSLTHSMVQDII
jgi:hypothetical protein